MLRGSRKVIKAGNSYYVTIPRQWIDEFQQHHGYVPRFYRATIVAGSIIYRPISDDVIDEQRKEVDIDARESIRTVRVVSHNYGKSYQVSIPKELINFIREHRGRYLKTVVVELKEDCFIVKPIFKRGVSIELAE